MTKDERQDIVVDRFVGCGAIGTFVGVTGFGKTRVAIKAIKRLRRTHVDREVIVIVPTEQLQTQWIGVLTKFGCMKNTRVLIINSAIKMKLECSLLILDEIHRYVSDEFFTIFNCVTRKFLLGLTATFKRMDNKHKLLNKICPVFDNVDIYEARTYKWISPVTEFNLGIQLDELDQEEYRKLEETYTKAMTFFMWDFGLMKDCSISHKPVKVMTSKGEIFRPSSTSVLASRYGWTGNSSYTAFIQMCAKEKNFWGGNIYHDFHPNKIYVIGLNGMRAMRAMKAFIQNHKSKISIAVELCERFKLKTITFSQTTERADAVTKMMLDKSIPAMSYHSALPNHVEAGKKLNKKKTRERVLEIFNKNEIRAVNTAMALDEGADVEDLRFGVRIDGTSSERQYKQRIGRLGRFLEGKEGIMVSLYLKDTTDKKWLSKSQGKEPSAHWVESIQEIEELIYL